MNKLLTVPLMTFASLAMIAQSFTTGQKADCCACRGGGCETHQHGKKNKEEQPNPAIVKKRRKKKGVIVEEEN